MSSKYLTQTEIENRKDECKDTIFKSQEEMKHSLSRLCYGNLHVIGSMWVAGMTSVLVGTKMCLIPSVEAAPPPKKDEPPKKPPKMKYKELPLYECPHWQYKQHLEDEEFKCLGSNPKILQRMALPTVAAWRKDIISVVNDFAAFMKECLCEMGEVIKQQKTCIKTCMRKEEHLHFRRAVVALGTTAGYVLSARRTQLLYHRLFWTSVGALSTGWLCFPKETDERFRDVGYEVHRALTKLSELWYGAPPLPVVAPCEKDMPPCPAKGKDKPNPKHECPKKPVQKPPAKKPPPPPPKKK